MRLRGQVSVLGRGAAERVGVQPKVQKSDGPDRLAATTMIRRGSDAQSSPLFCENLFLIGEDGGLIGLDPFLVADDLNLPGLNLLLVGEHLVELPLVGQQPALVGENFCLV